MEKTTVVTPESLFESLKETISNGQAPTAQELDSNAWGLTYKAMWDSIKDFESSHPELITQK